MALPNQIDPATPPGSEAISLGDDRIRALKQAIIDIFGLPSATNITNKLFGVLAGGLQSVNFRDTAANPATAGFFQRNGADLKFHDGTVVRTVAFTAQPNGHIALAGALMGNRSGNYFTNSNAFVPVDSTNLAVNVVVPTGSKFCIALAHVSVSTGGAILADTLAKVKLTLGGFSIAEGVFLQTGDAQVVLPGVIAGPPAGAQILQLEFRSDGLSNIFLGNGSTDNGNAWPARLLYIITT